MPESSKETAAVAQANIIDALDLEITAEQAPRHWRASLHTIAAELKTGRCLRECIQEPTKRVAKELQSLLEAALESSQPLTVISEACLLRTECDSQRWLILRATIYPIAIMIGSLGFACLVARTLADLAWMESGYGVWRTETNSRDIPLFDQANAIYMLAACFVWALLVLGLLRLCLPKWAWAGVATGLPVLGRLYGWLATRELFGRWAVFQSVDPKSDVSLLAASFRRSSLQNAATQIRQDIEAGCSPLRAAQNSLLLDQNSQAAIAPLNHPVATGADGNQQSSLLWATQVLGEATQQQVSQLPSTLLLLAWIVVGTVIVSICALAVEVIMYSSYFKLVFSLS